MDCSVTALSNSGLVWIQPGPDSCSSGVLFPGILPGARSSRSGLLVFPSSCSLRVQTAQNPAWLGVLPGLAFCPPLVRGPAWSRLLSAPDSAWSRFLSSRGPDCPEIQHGPGFCPPGVQTSQVLAFLQAFRVPPPGPATGAGLAAFCRPRAEAAA